MKKIQSVVAKRLGEVVSEARRVSGSTVAGLCGEVGMSTKTFYRV